MTEYVGKLKIPVRVVKGIKGAYLLSNIGGRLQVVTWPSLQKWEWNPLTKEWDRDRASHPAPTPPVK